MDRATLARLANEARRGSSRLEGAIALTEHSDPRDVVAWLRWNDPNGDHEYRPSATEEELERRPYYLDESECWEALADMLADT